VAAPAGGRQRRSLCLAHIGVGPLTDVCGGGGTGRGGAAVLVSLGSRRGRAADASVRAARSRPRAEVRGGRRSPAAVAEEGQRRSLRLLASGSG
jgi:hypothetical protein